MPCPPLRFLHAANAFLGSPVWVPGTHSDSVLEMATAATRIAFRNVVRACLDRDVDFLLLCGNTLIEEDRSLAARIALLDGLEQLTESGIPVFVLPGVHDPVEAWRRIPALPELVTVLGIDEEPSEVTRGGEVVAVIGSESRFAEERRKSDPGPIQIGLGLSDPGWRDHLLSTSSDYIARGGDGPRETRESATGIVHHPGMPQPLIPTGTNGACTLVEIDESRHIRLTPLSTAAVRFEHLKKTLDAGDTPGNLLQTLPGKLALRPAVDGERVRCVCWTLDGEGALWEAIQSPDGRELIERELHRAAADNMPAVVHSFELAREIGDERTLEELPSQFRRALSETPDFSREDVARRISELTSHRSEWAPRLEQLAGRVSVPAVIARAAHLGSQRLERTAIQGHEA